MRRYLLDGILVLANSRSHAISKYKETYGSQPDEIAFVG